MHEILKLSLQGLSAYKIARKLNLDPPSVYAGLKAAKKNFPEVQRMLNELRELGWPTKQIQNHQRADAQKPEKEEIALKMG